MRQLNSKQDFYQWLNEFQSKQLATGWAEKPGVLTVKDGNEVAIVLPFCSNSVEKELNEWISQQIEQKIVADINVNISTQVKSLQSHVTQYVKGVKNIIAVTSAKGGVGKSTTSVNLALAMANSGAKVGLLDADIYGPSVPMMLNQEDARPLVRDNKWMQPISAYGLYTHSIGYVVDKEQAAVWRGPMASKALSQLLEETEWPDLDYLVIDMPPGTGDIQLTLSQKIPVTAAVIVTTPQDLALADARKGANMFEQVNVPVVGMVENMSYHICSQCGHHEAIFGQGGAEKMAKDYGLSLLAQIPLHIAMREDIDQGKPTVVARPGSEHAQYYLDLADTVCSRMYWQGKVRPDSIAFTAVE
ncbi:iron-sulfur cluster carrier protein ApbC [Vibrio sp. S4M6]|uniref:iron-sulfur cluster carrier protein ApbC n=1 Tax=Vibrio sinus TaxID=2946865 RepID=UPI00202A9747|nr:iron-sulfur cluster carrier protein ApbC [Vibrio sinus]MCL9782625.1 iron-sulfur cluster carrier protein ApbC [Vibrio sinus]